ncbi:hypothetical protein GCM10027275_00470 [Rhabdobacter roseus]|uniref:Outer membrane protein beta-barrel domain-containing protein n=1 Tax=Rhabdobacter roseus TaxID=1655419 RepID=A0A840TFK0_9BACT|nr:outer membrane beta-barrel protein [Rhabdobacter roseus]MBB5281931.1 hypothetical protein [Rhabdobacter roseus]
MHTTYLRDLLHLHWPKVVVGIGLAFLTIQESKAQGTGYVRRHLEFYDDKPIHYGFLFAMPVTRFNIQRSDQYLQGSDSLYLIQSPRKAAFRVGVIANAYLSEHFDLRTTPGISLYARSVDYRFTGGSTRPETRESTWIEIPVLLKYKSTRRVNTRMYLLAGMTLGIETNVKRSRANGPSGSRLDTQTTDLTLDYGVGFEQFFEFFKFSPELRFSHGMVNLLRPTDSTSGLGLNRLTSHAVTLYINFE